MKICIYTLILYAKLVAYDKLWSWRIQSASFIKHKNEASLQNLETYKKYCPAISLCIKYKCLYKHLPVYKRLTICNRVNHIQLQKNPLFSSIYNLFIDEILRWHISYNHLFMTYISSRFSSNSEAFASEFLVIRHYIVQPV